MCNSWILTVQDPYLPLEQAAQSSGVRSSGLSTQEQNSIKSIAGTKLRVS